MAFERAAGGEQICQRLWLLEPILLEDRSIVDEVLGVQVHGDAIQLVVGGKGLYGCRPKPSVPVAVVERAGQVSGKTSTDEFVGEVTSPREIDVWQRVSCCQYADLILVGLIANRLE